MFSLTLKKSIFYSLGLTLVYTCLVFVGFEFFKSSGLSRLFILLGGDLRNGGIIQSFIVFSSLWAFFDIVQARKSITNEFKGLCLNLLPTEEKHVLLPFDLPNIEKKLTALKGENDKLMIKRLPQTALLKFKSTQSMSETIDVISIQSDISRELHESEQSTMRYLLWLIPSIGLMGTVIGISQALTIAGKGDIDAITAMLGVAFDTTLMSLVLSAIVTGLYHRLQEETDKLHAHMKEYVITNFVNRLEIKEMGKASPPPVSAVPDQEGPKKVVKKTIKKTAV